MKAIQNLPNGIMHTPRNRSIKLRLIFPVSTSTVSHLISEDFFVTKVVRRVIFIFFLCILQLQTFAQCNAILQNGIYDYTSVSSSNSNSYSFINWYLNKESRTLEESNSLSANGVIPIGDMIAELGFSNDQRGFQKFEKYIESYSYLSQSQKSKLDIAIKKVNDKVVSAWESCINSNGAHVWIEHTNNPNVFILAANFIPHGDPRSANPRRITSIDFGGESVSTSSSTFIDNDGNISGVTLGGNTQRQIFTRKTDKAFSIAVNVSGGKGFSYNFKEISRAPKPYQPPIILKTFSKKGELSNRPEAKVTVRPGYKIIGGGAKIEFDKNIHGCLLTESYPDGRSWIAKGKDHGWGNQGTITAYAIAIYDPNDEWDVRIFSATSSIAKYPEVRSSVDNGYTMTGGGVKSHWSGYGNVVTASYPVDNSTWEVKSKQHLKDDPANITAYAIGIKPKTNTSNKEVINRINSYTSSASETPGGSIGIDTTFKLTGGGAIVNWKGVGNILIASYPDKNSNSWKAGSKSHGAFDPATLNVYAIAIKFQ